MNADALGQGTEILYVGDYNIDSSSEGMYTTLLSPGNGQAFDPINMPGMWNVNAAFKGIHTQSTRTADLGDGGATGGMDDRFDFVLHSQEVGGSGIASNGIGLEYRPGSYRAFGNDNTHAFNGAITSGAGIYSSTVRTALMNASDHLPIVVDYDIMIPDVTFTSVAQSGAENGAALTITAQLSAISPTSVTVPFTVTGTATGGGVDYSITSSPLIIPSGQLSGTVTITPVNDLLDEADETVIVTMGTPINAGQGANTVHTATILDDDPTPTVSFTAASGSAVESVATRTLTVQLSAASAQTVTVPYTVNASSTATNPTDYTITTSPLTFAPGQISQTIVISVVDDAVVESSETVIVNLGSPTNANLGATTTFTETIVDNDAAGASYQFTAASYTTAEGQGTVTVTVTRSNGSGTGAVNYSTSNGSAVSGSDYSPVSGTLNFGNGQVSAAFDVIIMDDGSNENFELFNVALSSPVNGSLGAQSTATVGINDPLLVVQTLTATNSGVIISFNRAFDPITLNLYDAVGGTLGAADVTVAGTTGSLVVLPGNQLYFIRTGNELAANTYATTIRSAADGLKDLAGVLLDGDSNGSAGGNFSGNFAVASYAERVVRLGDFARGQTQTMAIPLTISEGSGVTAVQAELIYDPTLLDFGSGSISSPISGWSGILNPNFATLPNGLRVAQFTISSATPLSGSNVLFATIPATIPTNAPYASKQVLRLQNVFWNSSNVIRTDDAIHVSAYFGDANRSGTLTSGDAALALQLAVGQGTGLTAYQNADPALIVDANGNSTITSGDAALILQKAIGLTVPQIPTIGPAINTIGGPDPKLSIRDATGVPGSSIVVDVDFLATETIAPGLSAIQLAISWDPSRITFSGETLGSYLASLPGWSSPTVNLNQAAGTLILAAITSNPETVTQLHAGGTAFRLNFLIPANAPSGPTRINLRENLGSVYTAADNSQGALLLVPAPTNASTDAVDGIVMIRRGRATPPKLAQFLFGRSEVRVPSLEIPAGYHGSRRIADFDKVNESVHDQSATGMRSDLTHRNVASPKNQRVDQAEQAGINLDVEMLVTG